MSFTIQINDVDADNNDVNWTIMTHSLYNDGYSQEKPNCSD